MLFAIMFAFWRFSEILSLIPIMGMLAYFVNLHLEANVMTPTYILLLFIVSTLALAWAVFTLFSYHRSKANAQFVALIDLAFVGALIASVYYLRFIARANCASIVYGSSVDVSFGILGSVTVKGVEIAVSKTCGMLKGCFALGIMNCVFFFVTGVLAWIHGDHAAKHERKEAEERRRRSRSRRGSSHGGRRSGSRRRSGSHSSHSHHRAYV
ncbi:hypothetical protein C8A05DRAFT_39486 [Staphylotrichum tortipilum]|uniref:MARVEL domain-containing protein n=1 Tax=Staphylotrichum tortipilum TaxID=2831512 RepID=A0AAN6M9D6_9PEZI|nr:hypothetical protein C8A05DRAFT_39486 [Staphylotrichum longicolle]